MRHLYLLLFLSCSLSLSAAQFRGFLLTKDGYKLTGYLEVVTYTLTGNTITFSNDFGDRYTIHPFLINGFGFSDDGESYRFVSRFSEGQWYFLQVVNDDRNLKLYSLPESRKWVDDKLLRLISTPVPEYFIEPRGQTLIPVPRTAFKRVLREFCKPRYPELAKRIGKRGYRYKNIAGIIAEYNERNSRKRRRL